MFNKINNEIVAFTNSIKSDGYDKMLNYVNSSIYSCLKLLIFASKTFSITAKILMFFIIFTAGLLMLSVIGAIPFNPIFLMLVFLTLFVFALFFVTHFKKVLIFNIEELKS